MSKLRQRRPADRKVGSEAIRHFRRSAIALGVAAILIAPAYAQDAQTGDDTGATDLDTVVVRGVRGAAIRAQEIKQEATQIIDSVTAEDIGALPDRSVTETLKRVSGVTVTNFLARDDPDHFSAEGSGVMIRGLTQVRGELNGRDIFSANGGRGLSFEEVPSELMAGVDVYKNPSAEIIEGGLGGTVNLRTRMPFDEPGRKIAASVDYNYGDFARQGKPSGSFLFSDRWETGIGEVGFLANLSYSELATRSDGIQVAPFARRGATYAPPDYSESILAGTDFEQVFIPGGVNWRTLDFERKRQGVALALQWKPNENTEVYSQFLRSDYEMQWRERAMFLSDEFDVTGTREDGTSYNDGKGNAIVPVPGTSFSYDQNGVFQSGWVRSGNFPWHPEMDDYGIAFNTDNRIAKQETTTSDWSIGFKHFITDNLIVRGDFQYVKSESKPTDFTVFTSLYVPGVYLDLTGKYPSVSMEDPGFLSDPSNYYWRAAMDHIEDNSGESRAGRVDFEYTFQDSDWLRFVRFGARIADRGQVNYSSNWNWGAITDTWAPITPDGTDLARLSTHLTDYSELYSLGNFFRGNTSLPTNLWFPTDEIVDIQTAANLLMPIWAQRGWGWSPTSFQPQDRNTQDERTQAAYAVVYFENDVGGNGMVLDGNVGVRLVKTSVNTQGIGQLPDLSQTGVTQVTPEVLERFTGDYFSTSSTFSYTDVLPSLNLRLRFTPELQWRFAASKAIARPDFRQMQGWLPLGASPQAHCGQPVNPEDDDSPVHLCGLDELTFSGSSGNPELRPMQANQFDTALEWYFNPTSNVYATVFHKDVTGYFATQTRPEVIDGIEYQVTRPYNLDRGRIRGFELGYTQFFDFLPGWLSGFGIQSNFTYVDSEGGSNTIPDPYGVADRTSRVDLPLEGLSKRSYNVTGIYEKDRWSIRLAYNWRSRYLLTSSDVSTRLPTWANDYGQLDGSVFYNINDNIQIGLQANNITDSVTEVLMGPHLYESDGYLDDTLRTRAWFMNDRRYSAVLRARW